jgi:hypothetical protein
MTMGGSEQVLETMRAVRDNGMEAWARATIRVTSSSAYARLSGLLSQPGLIAAAVVRKVTETSMSGLLARLNMPSRADVFALSQRLTHIQMAVDDLGAAMDAMRASAAQKTTSRREPSGAQGRRWRPGDR